uniref:TBCC domain-containing protein 1 n=1 Tax=Ananas comosus var. bracteatus TaxID=296719 RepID=A0A6V7PL15_ANACO|nr:unnamed protein product [Ananas comosus var. bracteatus]
MTEDASEPSPPPSAAVGGGGGGGGGGGALFRPRREPFEHGLLPIPKLVLSDGTLILTLAPLKDRLLQRPIPDPHRVDAPALADALQIPLDHARLALDTLAAVLPAADPAIADGAGAADVRDLLLFLYIQSYKRLVPGAQGLRRRRRCVAPCLRFRRLPLRPLPDPGPDHITKLLSYALIPFKLVRSNSRRFMPSQADEEAHQLSYLQKHMANILTLLSDSVEGEGEDSLVLTVESFEHLSFLIQFSEGIPLSQAAAFFANSDPDMPAAPVPAAQVHEWVLQNIAASLENITEKVSTKENGSQSASDLDVTMADATTSNTRIQSSSSPAAMSMPNNPAYLRNQTFVEGIAKASLVKQAGDLKGHSVKVLNCHDSVIYILAPLKYATVYGCSDATIILCAIGKAVKIEHCERVQIITAAKRICIANCRECCFFLGINHQPLIVGDNHKLQVSGTVQYLLCTIGEHMAQVGVDPTINKWDQPFVLGAVDPHDSLSHPAGVSDAQAESATSLDPDLFTNFVIPSWFGAESSSEPTKYNPFPLPEIYWASQKKKHAILDDIQQTIRELQLDENRKRDLACALHVHFRDWLYASGNIRQLYCLQGD